MPPELEEARADIDNCNDIDDKIRASTTPNTGEQDTNRGSALQNSIHSRDVTEAPAETELGPMDIIKHEVEWHFPELIRWMV